MKLKDHILLSRIIFKIQKKLRKNKIKQLADISRYFIALKSILDDDYHSNTTAKEYKKYGHIYYKNSRP